MHLEPGLLLLPHNNRWSGKSITHKLLLSSLLLAVAVAPFPPVIAIAVGVLAGALACLSARITLHTWLELLAAPLLFAAAGGAVVAFSGPEGRHAAFAALARVFGAASATLLLATTTPILDIVALLQRRSGFRTLAELFLLSFRAAAAIAEAGLAMVNAIRLRHLGNSWRTAPRVYSAFAASLALRSLENAHRAEAGLAVRGFQGRLPLVGPKGAL
jgi:cobalt/nickel transport system permease protein